MDAGFTISVAISESMYLFILRWADRRRIVFARTVTQTGQEAIGSWA